MDEVLRELGVGERAVEARRRVAHLHVETARSARERQRGVTIDRMLVHQVRAVREAAAREILSRVRAGRSAALVVEDDHERNEVVELRGFEPLTPRLPALCSPN